MKIVYVIDSLASKGGAERILCDKMSYLAEHNGYDVTVITCYQDPAVLPNVYHLSPKVRQIDLKVPYYSQYHYRYPRRLGVKWHNYRLLRRGLTENVQRIDPDVLVGLGYFNADMVCAIKCRAAKVIESHEARIFTMSDKGLSRSWPSRLYMRFYRWLYFRRVEHRADTVVVLTRGDAREWQKAQRVVVIPNFTVMPVTRRADSSAKRVIAVGRLEWQKGYDRLLQAWAIVAGRHADWQLDIFGSGTLEGQLKAMIAELALTTVTLHAFTPDIAREYASSSLMVLASRFEGLSLVLLEGMQVGLPCVAFDCPFGPSDVIVDSECGYLVKDGDIQTLADRLCQLMEQGELRAKFSAAAAERIKRFDVYTVMGQWKELFGELTCQD